jgi:hypothetical protein
MNGNIGLARHGKRTPRLTQTQIAHFQHQTPRIRLRHPSYVWSPNGGSKRASIQFQLTFLNDTLTEAQVIIQRNFYRGGQRTYKNLTLATLRRFNSIFITPLLSDEQFAALERERIAQDMLAAGHAQNPQAFRLLDRVNDAIIYGQAAELLNDDTPAPVAAG